jgi:two-component system sensor histidine kinase KdpD
MAKQLGGVVFTYKGEDVADTILRFAKEYRVGHIVVGAPARRPWWKRLTGDKSLVHRLVDKAKGVAVVVVDTAWLQTAGASVEMVGEEAPVEPELKGHKVSLSRLLGRNILFWEEPVPKEQAIRALVHVACREAPGCDEVSALQAIIARDGEGSTFLSEGLAIPHARLKKIMAPGVALGITRGGIEGDATEAQVGYILLSLTPDERPEVQTDIFSAACHAFQDRLFLQAMDRAVTAEDVRDALVSWAELHGRTRMEDTRTQTSDTNRLTRT